MKLTDDERLLLDLMISMRNDKINEQLSEGADSEDIETDRAVYNLLRKLSAFVSPVDIDALVNRFLGWPLPKTFAPDCGISFKPLDHPNGWPIGTNLLTAVEAKAMFLHCLRVAESDSSSSKDRHVG